MKPYVLSIDPGLSTGVALVNTSTLELVYSGELNFEETGRYTKKTLSEYQDIGVIAEKFTITPATAKNSQAPWSLMVLGMLDWLLIEAGAPKVLLQTPANAKAQADNACLKRLGLWHKSGKGHANDALRHVVHYMVRSGWKDRRLLPPDEETP